MANNLDLSQLMQASQAAPVEGTNFYKETNEAFASIALNAVANTPESQIAAQEKQTSIAQQRADLTLSALIQAREKDIQAHQLYLQDYQPRSEDYDLLQSERRNNLKVLTQEETDPEKNNIFLHPIKTIVSAFKSGQIRDKNRAIVQEMNALSDEMAQANKEYISVKQFNAEELAFNLQTQVNLQSQSALLAAQQAQKSAALRYEDTQKDLAVQLSATQGLKAVDAATAAGTGPNAVPTDTTLAVYKANKLGTPYNPVIVDSERADLMRSFKSEATDVQSAVSQLTVRYTNYIKEGKGSTELPTDFTRREIVNSVNGGYARGLDKLTESRYSEIANIGLETRVQQIAAAAKSGQTTGLSEKDRANPALLKILGDSKNLADETALQLQIKGALEGDFSNSLDAGIKFLKEDMAAPVSNMTVSDKRPYVDTAALSSALNNSNFLLSNVPMQYLEGKDEVAVRAEADVVAKVAGMTGGNLASHKLLAANDFLKKLGMRNAPERVAVLQKWLQQGVMDTYAQRGAYSNLAGLAKYSISAKGEEFVVPLVTREHKGSGLLGRYAPAMPSLDLSTPAGLATYLELAEKGVLEQAKQSEVQGKQTQKFINVYNPFAF